MTHGDEPYYQPWADRADGGGGGGARPPAPPVTSPPTAGGTPPAAGLAKPAAPPPLGLDLASYDGPPPTVSRAEPRAKALASQFWAASRRAASRFADWTIALGVAADVPARLAALELARRSGAAALELARRSGVAAGSGWRGLRAAAAWAGAAAARGGGALWAGATSRWRTARIAPAPAPPPLPASGLDRLMAQTADDPAALPLFAPAPTAPAASGPPPASTAPTAAAGPRADVARPALPALAGPWPWLAMTAVLVAAAGWLGARVGGPAAPDRAATEAVVREYILANPQIIPQAMQAFQAQQTAAAVAQIRPALEKPFAGAWIGNPAGDVTVVAFTDYGCGYCRASVADVDRLVAGDRRVKVVFRELPIIAPASRDAALAALRAARQGKYDAFHHAMFAAGSLDAAAITAASTRAGVILDGRADAAGDARVLEREIDNNLTMAQQLGLGGTPAWIVGDRLLEGAVGLAELRAAVKAARAGR